MSKKKKKIELYSKFFKFSTTQSKNDVEVFIERLQEKYGKRIVYIGAFIHNKDFYDKYDELQYQVKAFQPKPQHIHFSIVFNQQIRLSQFEKDVFQIFQVEEKAKNGFVCIHRQTSKSRRSYELGMCNMIDYGFHRGKENQHKYQYSIKDDLENLVCFVGFNWNIYFEYLGIQNKEEHTGKEMYMKDEGDKETKIFDDVENGRTSIDGLKENDGAFYQRHQKELERRAERAIDVIPTPLKQTAFFITGNEAGIGKTCFSKKLAEALGGKSVYFIRSTKVKFQRYRGETSIVWSDISHQTLSNLGKEDVKDMLDPSKPQGAEDKKFGSVVLKNKYGIFNSIKSGDEVGTFKEADGKDENGKTIGTDDIDNMKQYVRRVSLIVMNYDEEQKTINITISNRTRAQQHKTIFSKTGRQDIPQQSLSKENVLFYEKLAKQLSDCFDEELMVFDENKIKNIKGDFEEYENQ